MTKQSPPPDAFTRIVEENYQRVYNVIYRLIEDRQEAEDLTQDTFVNAHRAFRTFRGDSQIYTWLYRIAVNLTKNRLERRARREQAHSYSLDAPVELDQEEQLWRQVEDWSECPAQLVQNWELGELLAAEVSGLRFDYKEVVILRDYEGLSYEEIASVVGCSVQAVKSRLFRARSVLRERLQRYLGEEFQ